VPCAGADEQRHQAAAERLPGQVRVRAPGDRPARGGAQVQARHSGSATWCTVSRSTRATTTQISPFDEYRSKEAKAWRDETEAQGLIPVKQADFDRAEAMATAIKAGIQRETRDEPYQTEVVMAWQREGNGFRFWCRG
jgi:hypothetical protein